MTNKLCKALPKQRGLQIAATLCYHALVENGLIKDVCNEVGIENEYQYISLCISAYSDNWDEYRGDVRKLATRMYTDALELIGWPGACGQCALRNACRWKQFGTCEFFTI